MTAANHHARPLGAHITLSECTARAVLGLQYADVAAAAAAVAGPKMLLLLLLLLGLQCAAA
jgi:hypothetical protein